MTRRWTEGARSAAPDEPAGTAEDRARATVLECGRRLQTNVARGRDAFFADEQAQDAVCYLLIRIAEAIRDLPDDVKQSHGDVDWAAVTGMRNRLAHQYVGVNLQVVWMTASRDIPHLLAVLGWQA